LEEALNISKPEIFNTDQGSQYTAANFLKILTDSNVKISMDSKGRALDNIFVERLWRTVKYEEVLGLFWASIKNRIDLHTIVINLDNGPDNSSRRSQFMNRLVEFAKASTINII
jgi:transposase InsO family protein